jgi:acyl-CoA synthetase (AMP-forming)/AMP-acid ligase II
MNELIHFFRQTAHSRSGVTMNRSHERSFMTYEQMYEQGILLAEKFKRLHFRESFIAAIWMDTSIEALSMFIAVVQAGGIPVPLHSFYTGPEIVSLLQFIEADAVCYSSSKEAMLQSMKDELPDALYLNGETGKEEGIRRTGYPNNERRIYPHPHTAVIFLSSGSTGHPKGIQLSVRNILSNMNSIQDYIGLNATDSVLLSKSLGYCSTVTGEWLVALAAGASIQLTEKFIHPFQMISHIETYRPTFMCTVPSSWIPLIKSSKWSASSLDSLQQLLLVGGPIAPDMVLALSERIPHVSIMPSYGLTEASPRVTYLPHHQLRRRPNSVGIPVKDVSLIILKDGQEALAGEEGEVIVNGPNVMLGYYGDAERTKRTITEKGLHTNDIGYLDQDGYLHISGRKDNALNIGGHTIYPEAVEKRLSVHPEIAEVAVTGVEDEVWGTRLIAYIVPMSASLTEQRLRRFCLEQLHAVQRPGEFIFVDCLPATKTGKVDRAAIKTLAEVKAKC